MGDFPCECEHVAHIDKESRTPNGNPGHRYQQCFMFRALVPVSTPYGTFAVCQSCARDCYAEYAQPKTSHKGV